MVCTLGVKDLVVVATEDAALVTHKDQAQNVGKLRKSCVDRVGRKPI
ncbi:MAG: hypothetical protein R3E60_03810 [Alphaproteobacteria bacterium]